MLSIQAGARWTPATRLSARVKTPGFLLHLPGPNLGFLAPNHDFVCVFWRQVDPSNSAKYLSDAQGFFRIYLDQIITTTPKGLAYPCAPSQKQDCMRNQRSR